MELVDHENVPVTLGRQIGRKGGEGSVYAADSHPHYVVKLYHQPPDNQKAAKLWHFCQIANEQILAFAAWPKKLVLDSQRKILRGFMMPSIEGLEIHQLFNPKERYAEFPSARWDFLIRVARNSADTFAEIHNLGVTIGDVNEGNILVKRNGTVAIIDCDSFQAQSGGYHWTCDVGVPQWTAPELQNKDFRGLHRTANHDAFGLAVLIFKLLFMGRHPFVGVSTNPRNEIELDDSIAAYHFAYGSGAVPLGLKPPPHCLPFDVLPKDYRNLFERAFCRGSEVNGNRPTARLWINALELLEKNLLVCKTDKSHRFPSHLSKCPWCKIADSGGPNFFASVHVAFQQGGNITNIWATVSAIKELSPSGYSLSSVRLVAVSPSPLPPPSKLLRAQFIFGILCSALGLFILIAGEGLLGLAVIVAGAGLLSGGAYDTNYDNLRRNRSAETEKSHAALAQKILEIELLETNYRRAFQDRRNDLERKYHRIIHLGNERKQALQALEGKKRQIQLDAFLDTQFLTKVRISGIGPRKIQTLLAYNIETAYDVVSAKGVPGIGPHLYSQLMEWRRRCEAAFRFNPNGAIPPAEIHNIDVQIGKIRRGLESDLQLGATQLNQLNTQTAAKRESLEEEIGKLIYLHSQHKVDLSAIPSD
ncbi:MAG TPA: hypothetical protein VIS99_08420 [Terrimicrobiaceae bacterium]